MSFATDNSKYRALSLKLDKGFRSYCVHAVGELDHHVYWDTENGESFCSPLPLGPWAWTMFFAQNYASIRKNWKGVAWQYRGEVQYFDRRKNYPYYFPEAAQITVLREVLELDDPYDEKRCGDMLSEPPSRRP